MPRRTGRRCPERTADTSTLDAAAAWELSVWRGLDIPGMGLETLADFEIAWREHGEFILREYVAVMPGSRPFALYVVGTIPVPPVVVAPYRDDAGRRIGERVFHDSHCYGHAGADEVAHLVALGIVSADEERAARRRIAEHGTRQRYDYRPAAPAAPASD
jgi:hypothetical protein